MIVARVPEFRIKRLFGRAEGGMRGTPSRVQASGITAGDVRSLLGGFHVFSGFEQEITEATENQGLLPNFRSEAGHLGGDCSER